MSYTKKDPESRIFQTFKVIIALERCLGILAISPPFQNLIPCMALSYKNCFNSIYILYNKNPESLISQTFGVFFLLEAVNFAP